jgi:NAD(P)-dependent dehydrogenase (short-subunit alcohol dehydrogenase family)
MRVRPSTSVQLLILLCGIDRLFAKGSKVTCNAVHPGIVSTEVTRHMNAVLRKLEGMFDFMLSWARKTPAEGAYTSVYAATAPELEGKGGLYLQNAAVCKPSLAAMDKEACGKLWALSEQLTGIRDHVSK